MTSDSQVVLDAEARDRNLRIHVADLQKKIQREEFDVLSHALHRSAVQKGFWDEPVQMDKFVAKMMLIVSEVSEVMEALRKSQGSDKVTEEIADVLIRTFDLYDALVEADEADPELYGVMLDKMKINAARKPKHGNRWG